MELLGSIVGLYFIIFKFFTIFKLLIFFFYFYRGNIYVFNLYTEKFWILNERIIECTIIKFIPKRKQQIIIGTRTGQLIIYDTSNNIFINLVLFMVTIYSAVLYV